MRSYQRSALLSDKMLRIVGGQTVIDLRKPGGMRRTSEAPTFPYTFAAISEASWLGLDDLVAQTSICVTSVDRAHGRVRSPPATGVLREIDRKNSS